MNVLEFSRAQRRMCKLYSQCTGCPLSDMTCRIGMGLPENDEIIVSIVERWSKEHHVESRQEKFLKLHPNALINSETGALDICPQLIGNDVDCDANISCRKCRIEYWLGGVNNDTE